MSSPRRYDYEFAIAEALVAYLIANLDDATFLSTCPVVGFWDPMSIDDASRCVVMVPSGSTMPESRSSADLTVEIGLKSEWAQPTMQSDFQAHQDRLNALRDKLLSPTIADDLSALCPGFGVDFVKPGIEFSSSVKKGWFYSETRIRVNCFSTATN